MAFLRERGWEKEKGQKGRLRTKEREFWEFKGKLKEREFWEI